ncbi:DUF2478 domain-containing protein [uncultured Pelagimonas sp.]|uniref:DUF2478 domain-containing protein n=1 Tax=uncultured Pelagimonas sp. TaxID=1618102 RepID=UPI00260FF506|nr:DUF2478 domain-containing protein [uncultured Pelagimonas sp.]
MKIAVVSAAGKGETDRLLAETAQTLLDNGISLAGIVKEMRHTSQFENGCDMKVRVLPDGNIIQITQDLGAGSDACRLDPSAIAEAVAQVESSDLAQAQLFILNKFGPEEAAGHGFVSAIGKAVDLGIPVLVGVSPASRAEFDRFADGLAVELPANVCSIRTWCQREIAVQV